ncbi:MAG: ATP-grasp domain-containing protein [Caldilineaceae bacterium]|nr:ATP-grasp domain-containing protein [Caldilineaceae bacterium]MBP8105984.1 ATP-grasp domain-containing protein [Caldilineaceae bacterium]MBP8123670.1 ATP-grasp domain-containing protein [Caldilineaceae bacterium]MBP9071904.1 ATP-grasp domain-containing protein [Caldilineaceae bacterium]
MTTTHDPKRALLLIHAHTYRAQPFLQAAQRAGIQAVMGVDMDKALAEYWDYPLGINFNDTEGATAAIIAYAQDRPLDAIIAVDDKGSLLAAQASLALGLAHNAPAAALAARDKFTMRTALAQAGVPCPQFQRFTTDQDRFAVAQTVAYPCVVKPLTLNGSRGVIRANDPGEFANAVQWVQSILTGDQPDAKPVPYLVEEYIPGVEVAVEGILDRGKLTILALFDKPDPLEGPFFEETLYITPSRLPQATQDAIAKTTADAAAALGLQVGPVHAELRINEAGAWIVEVAGRSIGGLCSKTLQFGVDAPLEELILRQAVGLPIDSWQRVGEARGVMMIPIPEAGILKKVTGVDKAEAVPGITEIQITAPLNYSITPLPAGDAYLGFIFAQDTTPADVEAALRTAHAHLRFTIVPEFVLGFG